MEAVKTAYVQAFIQRINMARGGAIGPIRDIEANFTQLDKSTKCSSRENMRVLPY